MDMTMLFAHGFLSHWQRKHLREIHSMENGEKSLELDFPKREKLNISHTKVVEILKKIYMKE